MKSTSYSERVRSLQYTSEIEERRNLLNRPHMEPLARYVETLRKKKGKAFQIPDFDPCDGGVQARLLILAETPGPKALRSGFVSRNNDDETAENTFRVLKKSGLKRPDTLLWNMVPWYLGSGERVRKPTPDELKEGMACLRDLLPLLPNLKAIVLAGVSAKDGLDRDTLPPGVQVFQARHPSPRNLNSRPDMEAQIVEELKKAAAYLESA